MKPYTLWLFRIRFFVLLSVVLVNCSKDTAHDPVDPGTGNDCCSTGGGSDTTRNGSGSGSGGTGNGGNGTNNTNGVTLVHATGGAALYYNFSGNGGLLKYLADDLLWGFARLNYDSTGSLRLKLVNADRGTMTATKTVNGFGYTQYEINFSNANYYTDTAQINKPDTTGKLQIWIYRQDGQNILPASGGHPAVKAVIQILGKFPTDPDGVGLIRLLDYDFTGYPVHPPAITMQVLQNIFSDARWKIDRFNWPG
jgi:hypothetical protein